MYQNNYLRELNHGFASKQEPKWNLPREEGDILILPDGYRWRIERTPTVGDLIKPGDYIKTSWSGTSLVIEVHSYTTCCCPHRSISGDKLCEDSWEKPKKRTLKYHRELTEWGLIVVNPGTRQNKDGTFDDRHHGYINELVAVGTRILHLFENNDDEVFVVERKKRDKRVKPWQIKLF